MSVTTAAILGTIIALTFFGLYACSTQTGRSGNWAEDLGRDFRAFALCGLVLLAGSLAVIVVLFVSAVRQ